MQDDSLLFIIPQLQFGYNQFYPVYLSTLIYVCAGKLGLEFWLWLLLTVGLLPDAFLSKMDIITLSKAVFRIRNGMQRI